MANLTAPHLRLVRLIAHQAVREHLTAQSAQRRAEQQHRQNPVMRKRAVNE